MPEDEQYRLGQEAGRALAAIHSVVLEPAERRHADGEAEARKQMVFRYLASRHRMAGDDATVIFVAKHVAPPKRLAGLHGDFHSGNLLLTPEGKLAVIGFDRCRVGDRWQDFQRAQTFTVPRSAAFVNGQIHAYFCGEPPAEFWEALAMRRLMGPSDRSLRRRGTARTPYSRCRQAMCAQRAISAALRPVSRRAGMFPHDKRLIAAKKAESIRIRLFYRF